MLTVKSVTYKVARSTIVTKEDEMQFDESLKPKAQFLNNGKVQREVEG